MFDPFWLGLWLIFFSEQPVDSIQKPSPAASTHFEEAAPWDAIWIEAEVPVTSTMEGPPDPMRLKEEHLSGKEWLVHAKKFPGKATYRFNILEEGEYSIWIRALPKARLRLSLNGGRELVPDFKKAIDVVDLMDLPDWRQVAWAPVDRIHLKPGQYALVLTAEMTRGIALAAVDCICISRVPFMPKGVQKPKVAIEDFSHDTQWFEIQPGFDLLSKQSLIDQRPELKKQLPLKKVFPKGQSLFIKGEDLPQKFWGVYEKGWSKYSREELIWRAQYLAKHGFNLVYLPQLPRELGRSKPILDDFIKLDEYMEALSEVGIRVIWGFGGFELYSSDPYPRGFFNELAKGDIKVDVTAWMALRPELQELQLQWVETCLRRKHPKTQKPYWEDSTLLGINLIEKNSLYWRQPLDDLVESHPLHAKVLRKQWSKYAQTLYQNEKEWLDAWKVIEKGEQFGGEELELYSNSEILRMPARLKERQRERIGDFNRFLYRLERDRWTKVQKRIENIGFKGLMISPSGLSANKISELENLNAHSLWDAIDRHSHIGGGSGGYTVKKGYVNMKSTVKRPGRGLLNIGVEQVAVRPFFSLDYGSLPPNPWRVEGPAIVASYGLGLQGWDGVCQRLIDLVPGEYGPSRFVSQVNLLQSPGLSVTIREGHIQESKSWIRNSVPVQNIFAGVDARMSFESEQTKFKPALEGPWKLPLQLMAMGKVESSFHDTTNWWRRTSELHDDSKGIYFSSTGELIWYEDPGRIEVRTSKTQGMIGYINQDAVLFPDMVVQIQNPFAFFWLTSMDQQPISQSKKILLTVLAKEKVKGEVIHEQEKKLLALGSDKILMEPIVAKLKNRGEPFKQIRVLNTRGEPTGETVPLKKGFYQIGGRYQTCYYWIER